MANPSTYDEIVGIRLALNNLGGLLASQPIGAMLDIDAIRAITGQLPSGYAVAVLFSGAAGGVVANGQLVGGYYVSSNGNIEPFAGGAVAAGMRVAAFDEKDAGGTAKLTSGLVTRLIPGITSEWIVLDDASSARLGQATRVTPGHRYLRQPSDACFPHDATFAPIADILGIRAGATRGTGLVVDATGNVVPNTVLRRGEPWVPQT